MKQVQVVRPEEYQPGANGDGEARGRWCCEQLEMGNILLLGGVPYELPAEDREFLLGQQQSDFPRHKNITYRPAQDRLSAAKTSTPEDVARLHEVMRRFSENITAYFGSVVPLYAREWKKDFATYRSIEEEGRKLRVRARNDLVHIDAFPSRPTNGSRILRIFTNINPSKPRVWETAGNFEELAKEFFNAPGLPPPREKLKPGGGVLQSLAKLAGVKVVNRSPYDDFMLRFHNYLKENQDFQEKHAKQRIEFPPDTTWAVFTDMVSHAVMSGQYALEQTFIIPRTALALPQKAPVKILEGLAGRNLTFA